MRALLAGSAFIFVVGLVLALAYTPRTVILAQQADAGTAGVETTGRINGTVTDETNGAPIAGICVEAFNTPFDASDLTDASGNYSIVGFATGDYPVQFSDCQGVGNYAEEWYDNQSDGDLADPVSVAAGQKTSGIDAAMAPCSPRDCPLISITVLKLNEETLQPLPGWEMHLYEGAGCSGQPISSGVTDGDGRLEFTDLPARTYSLQEELQPGWAMNNPPCQDSGLLGPASIDRCPKRASAGCYSSNFAVYAIFQFVGTDETFSSTLNGATQVRLKNAPADLDGDGLDEIESEILHLDITGPLPFGPSVTATVRQSPLRESFGSFEERQNTSSGAMDFPADSFFDVFFEIDSPAGTAHNEEPLRVECEVQEIPPIRCLYRRAGADPIPLLDEDGNIGALLTQTLSLPLPLNEVLVVFASVPLPELPTDEGSCNVGGSYFETITSGGLDREYILDIPPSHSGDEALPLLLNLHGYGGNASFQWVSSGLSAKADAAGFILVMPQGTGVEPHWHLSPDHEDFGRGPDDHGGPGGGLDDVQFIDDLLDRLESQLCIDTARIYVTGMSNGGFMSMRIACSLSDRVAAVAPVAGAYVPPAEPEELPCSSTRPVPVIAFIGTEDILFDVIEGEAIPNWATHNGCTSSPEREQVTEHVYRDRYADCDENAAVQLYVVEGGGHTWPGSPVDLLGEEFGETTDEISANDLMWDFFVAHPLAPAIESASGDVNCDRNVDNVDATLVLQYSAGLLDILACPESADVNSDSAIDSIDATLILQFTAGLLDILGPAAFLFPVGCELNVECSILYFVDEDPRSGQIQDYACGARTYDGHTGTDIVLRDWDLMDAGVDVYAVASGLVGRVKDGHFDRVEEPIPPDAESNEVVLFHIGSGMGTYYGHLRSGSITVAQGERVAKGQKIGEVGSSGQSGGPHLHFEVLGTELNPIDPWAGPCGSTESLWADQPPYEREAVIPPDIEEVSALSCDEMEGLRSLSGKEEVSLIFDNRLSATINIDWINYDGNLVRYATLLPGERYEQGTFLTHPWVVSNEVGECLGVYLPVMGVGLVTVSASTTTNVLVDATHDGGAWWFPQTRPFDPGEPHQGQLAANYMRSLDMTVFELPRGDLIDKETLLDYDLVIRANGFGPYETSEIDAYLDYVDGGGRILLLTSHHLNSEDDLTDAFGLAFRGITRSTSGATSLDRFDPHDITQGVTALPYQAGSALITYPPEAEILGYLCATCYADLNENEVPDADEPFGPPVLGVLNHGAGAVVFLGDTNIFEQVSQPLTDNILEWLQE